MLTVALNHGSDPRGKIRMIVPNRARTDADSVRPSPRCRKNLVGHDRPLDDRSGLLRFGFDSLTSGE